MGAVWCVSEFSVARCERAREQNVTPLCILQYDGSGVKNGEGLLVSPLAASFCSRLDRKSGKNV